MGKVKLKLFALLAVFAITVFTPALPVLADAPDCASNPKASGCPCEGSSATICDDLKNYKWRCRLGFGQDNQWLY